ncbi:MAG: hypothetical protein RMK29_14815 [Myxococcales bacterium]|nr:hypothetical protein [Myxococcota bacterium]MDW8282985.1 hypothetical protein [Myxococcales bacterium]
MAQTFLLRRGGILCCVALCCLPLGPAGCAISDHTIRGVGRSGVRGAVMGLGDSGTELRAAIRDVLLQDDLLQRIAERFTRGALVGLSEQEQTERMRALGAALSEALKERGNEVVKVYLESAGTQLEETLGRVASDSLARIDAAVKGLISQELTTATQRLIRRNAETLAQVLAAELEGALGRSLERAGAQVARSLVRQTMSELRSADSQRTLRDLIQAVSRDAVSGLGQGLRAELEDTSTRAALTAALVSLATLLLLGVVALLVLVHQYRQSTTALAIIAQKINEASPQAPQLKEAIREGARRNHVDGWLSAFLKNRGL